MAYAAIKLQRIQGHTCVGNKAHLSIVSMEFQLILLFAYSAAYCYVQ